MPETKATYTATLPVDARPQPEPAAPHSDAELDTIAGLKEILDPMRPSARSRILRYLYSLYIYGDEPLPF